MFVQYVKYMYNLLNSMTTSEDLNIFELLGQFDVNHLRMLLNLKGTVSRYVNLLKICKFCNKAFIANNPKSEYDTPQCKNKSNVYKSSAKNK